MEVIKKILIALSLFVVGGFISNNSNSFRECPDELGDIKSTLSDDFLIMLILFIYLGIKLLS